MSAPTPAAHPVLGALAAVEGALKGVAEVNPSFMDPDTQRLALVGIAAARARLDELALRIGAAAGAVAQTDAARDVAAWQVAHLRRDIGAARAEARLAEALDRRYETLRVGMAEGRVHLDQAHVIAYALDALPDDLDAAVLADAEAMLVDLAARHTPKELRRLGRRILDTAAPDIAEATLARQLEAEEASARRRTRLGFRPNGDGTTRISAVIPDTAALRLKTYLDAFTSPRQGDKRGEGPHPRILGSRSARCWSGSTRPGFLSTVAEPRRWWSPSTWPRYVRSSGWATSSAATPSRLPRSGGWPARPASAQRCSVGTGRSWTWAGSSGSSPPPRTSP